MQPKISYIVCGSPRSGNGLLCELLTSTGIAGQPEQYFGKEDGQKVWEEIWDAESENLRSQSTSAAPPTTGDESPVTHRDHIDGVRAIHCALRNLDDIAHLYCLTHRDHIDGVHAIHCALRNLDDIAHLYRRNPLTIEKYLAAFIAQRTMPNGVYGTQMMRSDFEHFEHIIKKLPTYQELSTAEAMRRIFPNLHYIWLQRQNKVRQAVSFAKALQTKVWSITRDSIPKRRNKPIFSFLLIDLLVHKLEADDVAWNRYFKKNNINPFIVIYEDLITNSEETVCQIIKELGTAQAPPSDARSSLESVQSRSGTAFPEGDLLLQVGHDHHLEQSQELGLVAEQITFGPRNFQQMADEISEEWVARYEDLKRHRFGYRLLSRLDKIVVSCCDSP